MEKWQAIADQNAATYQSMLDEVGKAHEVRTDSGAISGPSGSDLINRFLHKLTQLIG